LYSNRVDRAKVIEEAWVFIQKRLVSVFILMLERALICDILIRSFIWQVINFVIKTVGLNGSNDFINRISHLSNNSIKILGLIILKVR
tara:strand:+ start:515 stop:778 length:264 start_codon:yes stop_codon:yes gene_type:complete